MKIIMKKKIEIYREYLYFVESFCKITFRVRGVLLVIIFSLIILSFCFSHVENINLFTSTYFTWITALGVGYGDIVPKTILGEVISVIIGFIGIILFGLVVGVAGISVKEADDRFRNKEE